ncbi:hypothetical protein G6L37_06875 [Agrobacterium rubi]|nr:hypothetical protein [Agrobacterium rubi]NTF25088.1 hypothetical protein [Agrobacterium rubi]
MHWKTHLESRVANSIFTNRGIVNIANVTIRRFDSDLFDKPGWRFHKSGPAYNGWSDAFQTRAMAHAQLALHLTSEEDRLARALTGLAGFSPAGWLTAHRREALVSGNEALHTGFYRIRGGYIHVIRHHDGFISAFAVKTNRIDFTKLPEISEELRRMDRFMILKVDGASTAETLLLSTNDAVEVYPASIEEDGLFGVTANSLVESIRYLDSFGHADIDTDDD